MPVQTSYEFGIQNALPGLIYDMGNTEIDSFAAEANIDYGSFVRRGTDAQNQVLVGNATSIGIAVREAASENEYKTGTIATLQKKISETVGVIRSGYVWTRFDAAGGAVGAVVTINASGFVVVAGGATALTVITARIEKPAVAIVVDGVTVYVGLVKVGG